MFRIRRYAVIAALVLGIAFPVVAQEATDAPEPTVESTAEVTPEPTAVPTPDPVPPPVDVTIVPSWVFVVILAMVLGIVVVAREGIVQAAKGMPEWSQNLAISAIKAALEEASKVAKKTETPVDDATIEELRKYVAKLEADLAALRQQVAS